MRPSVGVCTTRSPAPPLAPPLARSPRSPSLQVGPTAWPLECKKDGTACAICAPLATCALTTQTEREWSWWYILLLVVGSLGVVVGLVVTCNACGGGGAGDARRPSTAVANPLALPRTLAAKTDEDADAF